LDGKSLFGRDGWDAEIEGFVRKMRLVKKSETLGCIFELEIRAGREA
jgi:hypothetical protein